MGKMYAIQAIRPQSKRKTECVGKFSNHLEITDKGNTLALLSHSFNALFSGCRLYYVQGISMIKSSELTHVSILMPWWLFVWSAGGRDFSTPKFLTIDQHQRHSLRIIITRAALFCNFWSLSFKLPHRFLNQCYNSLSEVILKLGL